MSKKELEEKVLVLEGIISHLQANVTDLETEMDVVNGKLSVIETK